MTTRRRIIIGLVGFAIIPVVLLVAAYNVPVSIALGPCLKDWTSPSSYGSRASKLDMVDVIAGQATVRVCYGRPSARGRTVFGGLVSYGRLWRTGANEPTRLFTSVALDAGGVRLEPGRYSIYVIPSEATWEVFFSRSTFHWGNVISPSVREREVGSATVPVGETEEHVDTLTIRGESQPDGETALLFEWERTRVALPLRATGQARPD